MLLLCIAVRDNDYPEPVKNPLKIGFGQWYLVVPCWLVAYLYIFFASFFASLRCFCSSSSVLTRHRCVKFHHLLISHLLFFCKGAESRLFLKESQKKAMHTKEVNSFLFPFPSQIFFFFLAILKLSILCYVTIFCMHFLCAAVKTTLSVCSDSISGDDNDDGDVGDAIWPINFYRFKKKKNIWAFYKAFSTSFLIFFLHFFFHSRFFTFD